MRRSRNNPWKVAICSWILIVCCFTGCTELPRQPFNDTRRDPSASGSPLPAPALYIPNSPALARTGQNDGVVKAATLLQPSETPDALNRPNDPGMQMPQHPMRILYQRAAQRYAAMDSYIYRLKRREVVQGRKQPEELIQVKLRREPLSVYLKWLGEEGKGREVIYERGKHKNEMQVLLPAGDAMALLGLRRHSFSPDAAMVRSKSRHPITDTGFGSLIESFGRMVAGIEKGDQREGTAKHLGRLKRPEFPLPVEAVHQVLAAGSDPNLPRGGQRWWFFDVESGLPVLLITHDPDGEVEYYCHDNIIFPVSLDDDDFNPSRLWGK